jgi:hypothetical protein
MKENYIIYDYRNDVERVVQMTATQAKAIAWLFDNFDFVDDWCLEKASDYEAEEVDE